MRLFGSMKLTMQNAKEKSLREIRLNAERKMMLLQRETEEFNKDLDITHKKRMDLIKNTDMTSLVSVQKLITILKSPEYECKSRNIYITDNLSINPS
jgi:hypothetical protein